MIAHIFACMIGLKSEFKACFHSLVEMKRSLSCDPLVAFSPSGYILTVMDLEFEIQSQQAHLLAEALKVKQLGHSVPQLWRYFPDNKKDIEIQLFNLTGKLPQRLTGDEDICMWILENEFLNRSRVCTYLGTAPEPSKVSTYGIRYRREDIPKAVLKRLATKICSLDAGKGFVEGMKLFVPIVGCWDLFADKASDGEGGTLNGQEILILKRILTEYVHAHVKHSDKPIFPMTTLVESNVDTIVEIALCVLGLSKVLHEGTKSSSTAMADFFADIRAVLREQASPVVGVAKEPNYSQLLASPGSTPAAGGALSLSMKTMTELFTATSTGLPLVSLLQSHRSLQLNQSTTALTMPSLRPSYLFAEHLLSGAVNLGWNLEVALAPKTVRLTHDALYIFSPDNELPEGCIPLEAVHVRTQDASGASRSALLTLTGLSGTSVPYVHLHRPAAQPLPASSTSVLPVQSQPFQSLATVAGNPASTTESVKIAAPYCGPSAVTYHAYALLDVANSTGLSPAENRDLWVDALESAAWECRASRSKHVNNS